VDSGAVVISAWRRPTCSRWRVPPRCIAIDWRLGQANRQGAMLFLQQKSCGLVKWQFVNSVSRAMTASYSKNNIVPMSG
jgi:hypothetical protein